MSIIITYLLIVVIFYLGTVTIGLILTGIMALKDYLEVEKMFKEANKETNRNIKSKTEYKIFTRNDYMKYAYVNYYLEVGTAYMDKELWEKLSKGYNFVIGVEVENDIHFFSVDYFNEKILGGK